MARLGRYFLPDQPLHIVQRAHKREPVFFGAWDYRRYLECLGGARRARWPRWRSAARFYSRPGDRPTVRHPTRAREICCDEAAHQGKSQPDPNS